MAKLVGLPHLVPGAARLVLSAAHLVSLGIDCVDSILDLRSKGPTQRSHRRINFDFVVEYMVHVFL